MPLREYRVEGSDEVIEELIHGDPPPVLESSAGRRAHLIPLSLPARTPGRWGDTPGNVRRYDRGLGCWVQDDRHAEAIAKSKGLISYREFGDDRAVDNMLDSYADRRDAHAAAEGKEFAEYDANLTRFDGDKHRAITETWSAPRILAGDTVFAAP